VRRGQVGTHLVGKFSGLVGGKTSDAAEKAAEVFAVDLLHREILLAFHFADIVNAADVGVSDLVRDAPRHRGGSAS
jgi:hypothetical protein